MVSVFLTLLLEFWHHFILYVVAIAYRLLHLMLLFVHGEILTLKSSSGHVRQMRSTVFWTSGELDS